MWTPDGNTLGNSVLSQSGTSIYQGVAGTSASGYYYFNTTTTGDSGLLFADNTSTNSGFLTYNHDVDAMKFGTSNTERMRISSNGSVGINSTSTSYKLFVGGTSRFANSVYVDTNTGADALWVTRLGGASEALKIYTTDSSSYLEVYQDEDQSGYGNLLLKADDTGDKDGYIWFGHRSRGEAMRIIDDGNVGIGTTSPFTKLHAEGVVTIKGSGTATTGSLAIQDSYGTTNHLGNIGWNRSAGGPYLAYGIKQDGSADWKSTFDNFSGMRSYMKLDNNEMQLAWAPAQQTTVDTVITGLLERFTFQLDSGTLKLNAYDGTNKTGTPTYLLGTDASGNVVKTNSVPSPITSQADSLYDLIPNGAFTTTYAFTSTAGTYAEVMKGDDVITDTGTYTVQAVVNDFAVGGIENC